MRHNLISIYIKRAKKLRILSAAALCCLILLFLLAVFPIYHKKEQTKAAAVPAATSIDIATTSSFDANMNIKPNNKDGTFAVSNDIDFTVSTNSLTGYKLAIKNSEASGALVNLVAGETLDSITTATDANTFENSTSASYINKWGIKPSMLSGSVNTNYLPAPVINNDMVLNQTSSANATPDSYTISAAARADYLKASGVYTKTFIIAAVGNPISYEINYYDGSSGSDVLWYQEKENDIAASKFQIYDVEPEKTDYVFLGWCYGDVTYTDYTSTCSPSSDVDPNAGDGTVYQASDDYSFAVLQPVSGVAQADFHAMWGLAIQNLDASMCLSAEAVPVYDVRDKEEYHVQKLPDNNCWLLDNLRVDIGDAKVQAKLNSTTTHASDTTLGYLINGGGTTTATDPWPISGAVTDAWTSASQNVYDVPHVVISGANWDRNTMINTLETGKTTKNGAYYNFCALTAGSVCYSLQSGSVNNSGVATEDICPAGWHVPTSFYGTNPNNPTSTAQTNDTGEWGILYKKYNNATNFSKAVNIALSGVFVSGNRSGIDNIGRYWTTSYFKSSQTGGKYDAGHIYSGIGNFALANNGFYRGYGVATRCTMTIGS